MPKFVHKPTIVEAFLVTGEKLSFQNGDEKHSWTAYRGDVVMRGIDGELYKLPAERFVRLYDAAPLDDESKAHYALILEAAGRRAHAQDGTATV